MKHFGTELRDRENVFEVYNENIMTGFVNKDEIVDRWAQDSEHNPRKIGRKPPQHCC